MDNLKDEDSTPEHHCIVARPDPESSQVNVKEAIDEKYRGYTKGAIREIL